MPSIWVILSMDYIAGEDLKAGDYLKLAPDGKLYRLDSKKISRIAEKEFIDSLRSNPVFKHLNIDKELFKIDEWLKRHPGRVKTRRFVLAWFNRQEVPLTQNNDIPESLRRFIK